MKEVNDINEVLELVEELYQYEAIILMKWNFSFEIVLFLNNSSVFVVGPTPML